MSKIEEIINPGATSIAALLLRADPNPVIQRALKVLADSQAHVGGRDDGRIIIYKPTYNTNSAEVEHLKWKLDISESRRRRLANTNLKSSPYHSDPVSKHVNEYLNQNESLFGPKQLDEFNSQLRNIDSQLDGMAQSGRGDWGSLRRIERRLSNIEKNLATVDPPSKTQYITQLNTSIDPSTHSQPIEIGLGVHTHLNSQSSMRKSESKAETARLDQSGDSLRQLNQSGASLAQSDPALLDDIASKNIEIGTLKEQVYNLKKQLQEENSVGTPRSLDLSTNGEMFVDDLDDIRTSDPKNASQASHENENLNETVRELRDRLILHTEDDSDIEDDESAEKGHR